MSRALTCPPLLPVAQCPQTREIVMGEVPEHYMPQIQVCMEVCDLESFWFLEYKPAWLRWLATEQINVVHVLRDRQWFADSLDALHSCWLEFTEAKRNPALLQRVDKPPRARSARPRAPAPARAPVAPLKIVDGLYDGEDAGGCCPRQLLLLAFPRV